ncbi:MAG: hypothetical protein COV45_02680 [Deltaproteobacteria bacterium CG11_big_fil_rev_8_21_14_0_20_47_16]|nr:MAG: hypothetical protein COV45_02680 [Deltaproteobacteria bacterium CG11_big_fil_rev_8_21_14_0_20_47_16]
MTSNPVRKNRRIILAILLPLVLAAILDPSVTGTIAARIVGHMDWASAIHQNFEDFDKFWESSLFFFALRAASYLPVAAVSIIISFLRPHWYWRILIGGLLIVICSEIYWTWDLVAIFYRPNHGHISSTTSLGFLVTPFFVGATQGACAAIIAIVYYVIKKIKW